MRIAELSARTGVSSHLIRMWERRYGLVHPARSTGGYRLYGEHDITLLREVRALREAGVPAGQAVVRALDALGGAEPVDRAAPVGPWVARLHETVARLDQDATDAVLTRLFVGGDVAGALDDVLVPFLRELGDRWADGSVSVAHEHFAAQLIRRRLAALAGGATPRPDAPLAILACPSGEQHDIMLTGFGVLLAQAGWRVLQLGLDTPIRAVSTVAGQLRPDLVTLGATRPELFWSKRAELEQLRDLVGDDRLALAGRGADPQITADLGVRLLTGSPTQAAAELAA